jgi:hypothetical protein
MGELGRGEARACVSAVHPASHPVIDVFQTPITEKHVKRYPADPDVDSEHAIPIEIRRIVEVLVRIGDRQERQAMVFANEEQRVTEGLRASDIVQVFDQ